MEAVREFPRGRVAAAPPFLDAAELRPAAGLEEALEAPAGPDDACLSGIDPDLPPSAASVFSEPEGLPEPSAEESGGPLPAGGASAATLDSESSAAGDAEAAPEISDGCGTSADAGEGCSEARAVEGSALGIHLFYPKPRFARVLQSSSRVSGLGQGENLKSAGSAG